MRFLWPWFLLWLLVCLSCCAGGKSRVIITLVPPMIYVERQETQCLVPPPDIMRKVDHHLGLDKPIKLEPLEPGDLN